MCVCVCVLEMVEMVDTYFSLCLNERLCFIFGLGSQALTYINDLFKVNCTFHLRHIYIMDLFIIHILK